MQDVGLEYGIYKLKTEFHNWADRNIPGLGFPPSPETRDRVSRKGSRRASLSNRRSDKQIDRQNRRNYTCVRTGKTDRGLC